MNNVTGQGKLIMDDIKQFEIATIFVNGHPYDAGEVKAVDSKGCWILTHKRDWVFANQEVQKIEGLNIYLVEDYAKRWPVY